MDYVVRAIAESPEAMSSERLGARVQELIAAQLLDEWATQAGLQLGVDVASAEPAYVRSAEEYIDTFARSVPTASEIAAAVGVSVRALTAGFRRYRDTTPGATIARASVGGCTRRTVAFRRENCLRNRQRLGLRQSGHVCGHIPETVRRVAFRDPESTLRDSCLNGHDDRFTHSMNCRDPLFRVGAFCKD